jgi:hypothetical protein
MRFQYGPPPEDEVFHPEVQGWSDILEPSPKILNFLAIPPAFLLLAVTIFAISKAWDGGPSALYQESLGHSGPSSLLVFLIVLTISIPLHELIHILTHPQLGRSSKSCFGIWLAHGLFYAHYDGEVSRNRFLSILVAPYLLLAWPPVILLGLVGHSIPVGFVPVLVSIALVNSVLPSGDVLGFFLMLSQVPSSACIKNKGWKSYWKHGGRCGGLAP